MAELTSSPPPPPSLGPKGLTIGLVLLTLIPFLFVISLYFTLPPGKDPVLEVQVSVASGTWTSEDGTQTRMLPSLILKNPTSDSWQNVNASINGQYDYYHPKPIQAGEELVVPLKYFHTKGNQFFSLEHQPLDKLTIYAQIPSGARAIQEISGEELLKAGE